MPHWDLIAYTQKRKEKVIPPFFFFGVMSERVSKFQFDAFVTGLIFFFFFITHTKFGCDLDTWISNFFFFFSSREMQRKFILFYFFKATHTKFGCELST